MSANGLAIFDKTLQTTNIWLDEIMADLGPDRDTAWRALGVVLHRLRNRLPVGLSANLGAQLPLLVRGLYYDQYQPYSQPSECNTLDEFCREVGEWLQDNRPVDPETAVKCVFRTLAKHVSPGEIGNVVQALPEGLRGAWPKEAQERARQQNRQSAEAQQQNAKSANGTAAAGSANQSRPSGGVEGPNESIIARESPTAKEQREPDLEPASPEAQQRMVGGAETKGPAR